MKLVELARVLQPGQEYVERTGQELSIDLKAVSHDIATDTCFEKARLIGWNAEQVVKAVFLYRGNELYGFVFPELGTEESPLYLDKKEVIQNVLGVSGKQAKSFHNSYCPSGMEYGTCTPFVPENPFNGEDKILKRMFIHDVPRLDDKLVDISIGGTDKEAHKVSLHLPYSGIYRILHHVFGDKIQKIELFGGN